MRLKSNLYVRITPQGSSSHVPKDFLLWGSFTKDYKVYTMVFTIISTLFYLFKDSICFYKSFDPTNNMKLLNVNYPKSSNLYPLYT
jgi:hypothetical protein